MPENWRYIIPLRDGSFTPGKKEVSDTSKLIDKSDMEGKYRTNKRAIATRSSYGYEPHGLKRSRTAGLITVKFYCLQSSTISNASIAELSNAQR